MRKDGILLEIDGERAVFNHYSFCELIKRLLVHYTGISYADADKKVERSHLAKPIVNAADAGLLGHELPYYWAMSLYYGPMYWENGVSAQPQELAAYFALEDRIREQYGLREPFE